VDERHQTHFARADSSSGDNCWRLHWALCFESPLFKCRKFVLLVVLMACAAWWMWTKAPSWSSVKALFSFCLFVALAMRWVQFWAMWWPVWWGSLLVGIWTYPCYVRKHPSSVDIVYRCSLTGLWQNSAIVLPGFVLDCHILGQGLDKVWHVLANVSDTKIWLEHGKSMVKTRHWYG